MTGFTFDSTFADGSPRRYAGTWRPDRDAAVDIYDRMPHNETINTMKNGEAPGFFELNWWRGVLDRPLYHLEEWE